MNTPRHYRPWRAMPRGPRVDTRPTAPERGYDAAWAKLRNLWINQHPMCQWPGCSRPADIVDHILPIRDRPDLRLDLSNLQSLCRSHHGVKTDMDNKKRR